MRRQLIPKGSRTRRLCVRALTVGAGAVAGLAASWLIGFSTAAASGGEPSEEAASGGNAPITTTAVGTGDLGDLAGSAVSKPDGHPPRPDPERSVSTAAHRAVDDVHRLGSSARQSLGGALGTVEQSLRGPANTGEIIRDATRAPEQADHGNQPGNQLREDVQRWLDRHPELGEPGVADELLPGDSGSGEPVTTAPVTPAVPVAAATAGLDESLDLANTPDPRAVTGERSIAADAYITDVPAAFPPEHAGEPVNAPGSPKAPVRPLGHLGHSPAAGNSIGSSGTYHPCDTQAGSYLGTAEPSAPLTVGADRPAARHLPTAAGSQPGVTPD